MGVSRSFAPSLIQSLLRRRPGTFAGDKRGRKHGVIEMCFSLLVLDPGDEEIDGAVRHFRDGLGNSAQRDREILGQRDIVHADDG